MNIRHAQMLLAAARYYAGPIDGDAGPMTRAAVKIIEGNARADGEVWGSRALAWPWDRRLIAAGQAVLNAQGFEAGAVDGWAGHNTHEALTAWLSARVGTSAAVTREPVPVRPDPADLPRQRDCPAFYGQPGTTEIERRMTYAEPPFALRLDWALGQPVRRLRVHELCAPSLVAALVAVEAEYGIDRMRELGIDRYAGGYNPRRMRAGSAWSMHAYGCAVDFYAAPNALRTRAPAALFSGPDYTLFLDIMEAHGWLNGGRLWGTDFMHFQQARL
ncbi:M15 family metallopeptidase [Limimaricola sp.]|uniref:M15 family metallopeptidase n=1 Tax=Limimaricola sp. TaxID=2211665 RepID=UPI0040582ED9